MDKYMEEAIRQAKKAMIKDEVPVGAVIVKNDKIISRAYNRKEHKKNAIMHAEIIAIDQACKKNKSWHLDDCTLYTTMEPCMMCCGAIIQSRIKKIVFIVENPNYGCIHLLKNSKIIVIKEKNDKEIKKMLKMFFKKKRINN